MKKISIITGGAGGMGLATAKVIGRDHHVIICDVNKSRLESATTELRQLGISCSAEVCDITNKVSVNALFRSAIAQGQLVSVVHTAGLSPQMANPETIMRVNALGTINIADASYAAAEEGFVLVNVASSAGHMMPGWLAPSRAYPYALTDIHTFLKKVLFRCRLMPTDFYRKGIAYAISKHFVMWFSKKCAAKFGKKGARILSVSPGTFDTEMGRLEEKSGSMTLVEKAALKRLGTPAEMGELLAFCASEKASYLTGTDILCDGGVTASTGGNNAN